MGERLWSECTTTVACFLYMIAAETENLTKSTENFSRQPIFGPDAPAQEPLDEEQVLESIYKDINPNTPRENNKYDAWYFRMLCLQEWFIRSSWINKFLFLDTICQSTAGSYVLENVLKSIEYINSKDVLESLSRDCTDYDFDRIPIDNNRALNEQALNEAMKEDFYWFSNLEPVLQIRVILKLLRLGGGGLIYEVYKSVERACKERREVINCLTPSEIFKPQQESKQKLRERSKMQVSKISMESKMLLSEGLEYGAKKTSQLARRDAEILAFRKARGIYGGDSKTGKRGEGTETVDYLQILPIQVNRKIISYIDDKSLSGLKRVGKYWDKMIDESINEKSGRKTITGKINKVAGMKADKTDRDVENMREPEMVDCIGESKLKEAILKKNPRATLELEKSCQKLSKNFEIKILDSAYFEERCGDFDASASLLACSSANNMVHFYSVRTGKRMNFSIYGIQSPVTCLTLHEDHIHIIVGCADGSLISKDMRNNKTNASFNGHTDAVFAVYATSSNLLSGSKDNVIKYFHLWSGLCLLHVDLNPEHNISTLAFRPGPPVWAIVGTKEGDLIVVDVNARRFIINVRLHDEKITQVVYEDDFLITGSDWGNVRTWNANTLSDNFYLRRPYYNVDMESSVTCLFFYKNQIFCGCENGTVKVISMVEGKVLKIIKISSSTSILGIKITEDNFSMKLIIWHEKGIEIRSFPLGKLSSKKKAIGEDNRESKQKAPTGTSKNKTSDTVRVCFGRAHAGPIEPDESFAKKAILYPGVKRPTKITCCTLPTLRQPQEMSGIYCSDVFTAMLNTYSSESGKGYTFSTFPRYNKP